MAEKTQTQKDTEKANSRVFRSRVNVRGDDGKTTLTTFSRDSYQHETNQDVFDIEQGGGDLDFNGTVILCINGNPYYINIAYDADKGPYSTDGNDPDFPILEP